MAGLDGVVGMDERALRRQHNRSLTAEMGAGGLDCIHRSGTPVGGRRGTTNGVERQMRELPTTAPPNRIGTPLSDAVA